MNILIQRLNSDGKPDGPSIPNTLARFLVANDGFSIQEAANMQAILAMGSGYLIDNGTMGSFRLRKIENGS